MDILLIFFVLAVTVEALVEYVKTIISLDAKSIILQLSALVVAVLLCIITRADIYGWLGIDFSIPIIGCVLTGVFASRGANYASDLIGKLQSVGKNT